MDLNLAIVEDNAALRRNLADQCAFFPGVRCVGAFASGEEALRAFAVSGRERLPDVVLMDIELPGISGIDATIEIREKFPSCDILILTVFENDDAIFRAIRAGASGYLLKDEPFEAIIDAVRELARGGAPMSAAIASRVLGLIRGGVPRRESAGRAAATGTATGAGPDLDLSPREREILDGLVGGETYATLAEKHFISPHTVRTHIKNIYRKLHVQSRAEAVRVALRRGLV